MSLINGRMLTRRNLRDFITVLCIGSALLSTITTGAIWIAPANGAGFQED